MCHLISLLKDTIPIRNSGKRMNKNVFPRRGVSLEGDPIARSRQVEVKQPTPSMIIIAHLYFRLFLFKKYYSRSYPTSNYLICHCTMRNCGSCETSSVIHIYHLKHLVYQHLISIITYRIAASLDLFFRRQKRGSSGKPRCLLQVAL